MSADEKLLRQVFVEDNGILTDKEFEKFVSLADQVRRPLAQILMEKGLVSPQYFLKLLSEHYKVPATELKIADIDQEVVRIIPEAFALKNMVVAFGSDGEVLKVAMSNPGSKQLISWIEKTAPGIKVKPYIALSRSIHRAFVFYRGNIHQILENLVSPSDQHGKTSVVDLLDAIINNAILLEASDIHVEPFEEEILIRFRVDGMLKTVARLPRSLQVEFTSRIKVLASLQIDEHRIPQDGRFRASVEDQVVDVRVSTVPSYWGEKVVMRILLKEGLLYDLTSLGLLEHDLELVKSYIRRPFGMILACGPTGCGKTTTLYAFIQQIGMEKIDVINISTVEDPIEYSIPRVTQIQIQPRINLTFSAGLRALLRQDPDIIMVGEIRDRETADIAVRVSLTGRLLFSTLHTNDAISAIPRLLDIGIEPYLISSTVSLVIAQRLIRKLCLHCRESYKIDQETMEKLKSFYDYDYATRVLKNVGVLGKGDDPLAGIRLYRAKGCNQCDHSGYQGRTSVFEFLEIDEEIKRLILKTSDYDTLKKAAMSNHFKTLSVDGLAKAILGITDLEEVMRTTV